MSKLEQLIQELCPEEVEYKTIKETVGVNRGKRLTKNQLLDNGKYEVYHGSKDSILGKFNRYNAPAHTTIVVNTGGIGGVKYLDEPFWCSDGSFWLGQSDYIDNKYLFYCLSGYEDYFCSKVRVGGVPTIDRSVVENFKIPVPPLPVQHEIVQILDQFTELEAELEAELEKREKQYEHYRSTLLKFGHPGETSRKTLGEIATIKTGSKPGDIMRDNAPFKHINAGTAPLGYVTSTNCKGNVITTPSRGSSIGFIGFQHHDFWLGALCYQIRSKGEDVVLNRYLFHYLACHRDLITSCKKDGAIPALNLSDLKSIAVTFPPLPVQREIVRILDQFSTLCTDLTSGLPAEISARKKQYEYYREKLLTFRPMTK